MQNKKQYMFKNLLNLFPFKLCVIYRPLIYRPTLKNRITQQ